MNLVRRVLRRLGERRMREPARREEMVPGEVAPERGTVPDLLAEQLAASTVVDLASYRALRAPDRGRE